MRRNNSGTDEVDRMLDMGFSDAIDEVIRFAPETRQVDVIVFSNPPDAIAAISGRALLQRFSIRIEIDTVDALLAIEQQSSETSAHEKFRCCYKRCLAAPAVLRGVLYQKDCQPFVMRLGIEKRVGAPRRFCSPRPATRRWCVFANGSARILVATDAAARGARH
ncbi:hypothetical protein KCP70_24905 [Salmonella enterica subsp. enterica]|nr:hypothetical protein KCP70_24905 [Salmonella enterica subsp. enterica]